MLNKRTKLVSACLILLTLITIAVATGIWIYSNPVPVTVIARTYSFQDSLVVDNSTPTQYDSITFSGTLYYGGTTVIAGYNVTLFKDGVPTTAWNLTGSDGKFSITYNATEEGTFNFTAGYETP